MKDEQVNGKCSGTSFWCIADVISERITQKKKEHVDLEKQILLENVQHPMPTINEIRFFMEQFKKGDVNDMKYRQALVDTFINKIYLYNDKMTILFNAPDSHSDVTLDDLSSSGVGLVRLSEKGILSNKKPHFCYNLVHVAV